MSLDEQVPLGSYRGKGTHRGNRQGVAGQVVVGLTPRYRRKSTSSLRCGLKSHVYYTSGLPNLLLKKEATPAPLNFGELSRSTGYGIIHRYSYKKGTSMGLLNHWHLQLAITLL